MNHLPKVYFIIVILLSMTGCWDRVELNDVSIVTGIAIDKGEEQKYKLTIELINAAENAKQQAQGFAPSITYSQEGNSLSELANKMNVGMTRKMIYSHTRIVVLTKEIAEEGLLDFIDYLERSGEFRNDFNILIYEGESAAEALKITYPLQKNSSLKVNRQIETFYQNWGGDPDIRLTDFITALSSKGREPVLATIRVKGDPEKGKTVENMQTVEQDALIEVSGLAIFRDDKYVGTLGVIDARNYLWLEGLESTSLTVPCQEEGKFIGVRVRRSSSSIESSMKNGKPYFKVTMKAEGKIEATQCIENLEKINTYQDFEEATEKFVKDDVTRTIQLLQEKYESDVFGFGEALERQHYDDFQKLKGDWDHYFAEATIDVDVDIHIRRSGIRNKSFRTENEGEE
ncbi:Ger(x)C family spore germination protein [Bacillus pinisoli]|uniref:Ger(x)C family spore germination protein n=1 Tax=Bacillus pinisoli TaxID=2901866 RepID=UPI001FF28304|nr:Ger(x)C family spore germination protein [Bacillus pinisoli]